MQDYKKILFFCMGLYLFFVGLTNFANINYLYALDKSKKNSLKNLDKFILENKNNEKIIVFGASVVLFGVSAEKINQELSLPSVNASSFGTLNDLNEILEKEILPKLSERDTLIFSDWRWRTNLPFEKENKETLFQIIHDNFEFLPNLDVIKKKFLFLPPWFKNRTSYGDIFEKDFKLNENLIKIEPHVKINENSYRLSINLLKSQLKILSSSVANIYLTFTPIFIEEISEDSFFLYNKKFINEFKKLNNKENIKFLDENLIFLNSNFYLDNTHLNPTGRDEWTSKIINKIYK